ncbi:MAG: hypothetical protein IJ620_04600 [Bacteroidales bacterium]|nr:hypothetical protein [Bacteroidales bacterium]
MSRFPPASSSPPFLVHPVSRICQAAASYPSSADLSGRPQAAQLLTLTTADGMQHTVRLLKQSDIFAR